MSYPDDRESAGTTGHRTPEQRAEHSQGSGWAPAQGGSMLGLNSDTPPRPHEAGHLLEGTLWALPLHPVIMKQLDERQGSTRSSRSPRIRGRRASRRRHRHIPRRDDRTPRPRQSTKSIWTPLEHYEDPSLSPTTGTRSTGSSPSTPSQTASRRLQPTDWRRQPPARRPEHFAERAFEVGDVSPQPLVLALRPARGGQQRRRALGKQAFPSQSLLGLGGDPRPRLAVVGEIGSEGAERSQPSAEEIGARAQRLNVGRVLADDGTAGGDRLSDPQACCRRTARCGN